METNLVANIKIKKITANQSVDADDQLAVEEPLEIQLRYGSRGSLTRKSISVTMRTPGQDEELAVGFLFTEGIIQNSDQVKEVNLPGENIVLVTLREGEIPSLQKADRNFYTTSSCGVCGKSSIDSIRTASAYQNSSDAVSVKSPLLYGLQEVLRKQQTLFESTGGLHASALFDLKANLIMLREDVGRHNALDKIIGATFMTKQLPLNNTILVLSGRASFELVQKASMAGIKVIAAIGAPSNLAVELAREFNMTLVGFLRDNRFNIYSAEHRIIM